ncbi:uncharacterized protein LOC132194179 isoform X2 [Neocloeon triangulifer]|nr:uncharacterized protein LOC132194179 isoform X2 [Neocloeon triangulifer]XP_059471293.1 uncharacterized protein LOC132194179 isoform X2 [Neocloeon triangulifer]
MSAPTPVEQQQQRHVRSSSPSESLHPTRDAKWIKPCGMGGGSDPGDDSSLGADVDSEMFFAENEELNNIVLLARTAQGQAHRFRDEYVKSTFNVDFVQHHETWKDLHYSWLPSLEQIPKNLGESTPVDHLQHLELPKALQDSYKFLQTFAVGLEQVVWDQEDGSNVKGDFQATEYSLRSVLCEIHAAMIERGVKQHPDITRDIMSREFRNMNKGNSSVRNLRDWFIFRDYMNGLEYVIDVFEYFINKAVS